MNGRQNDAVAVSLGATPDPETQTQTALSLQTHSFLNFIAGSQS
jgi:hypothetical protein